MKSFKSFISEEVLPTANVEDGHFDLENDAVRAEINSILSGICSNAHVTPYVTLRKMSKALAYFGIILPKKTFLEGEKGVEVYEMMQYGEKMGMTNQGEFVREVPAKYYLFFQYRMMNGKYHSMAKVVDKVGLDKLLSVAEVTMAECWDKVTMSQRKAGRDDIQTNADHGSPSFKKAADTSERKKDKKLANGELEKQWPAVDTKDLAEQKDGEGYTIGNEEEDIGEGVTSVKKSYAMRKMKKKVSTAVKQGLGVGKEKTSTVLVTNKGDPKAASGGGVHRISKDKYDPAKHNLASE
jgi:hypothetical protein